MAQLAFNFTYMIGTMAGCQPIARKFFAKLDTRIVIGGAVLLSVGGFAAISLYTSYDGWLVSGDVIGFGFSFITYLMGPILISNWFKKNAGTVLGVVLACSNLGGAVFGTVSGKLIAGLGWQSAMLICAAIALAVGLPFAIFGLKYAPNTEKGECAFGGESGGAVAAFTEKKELKGYTFAESLKTL